MNGGDALAIYAAVAATASILWQVYTWSKEKRTRVEVDISFGVGVGGWPDLVLITATNRSLRNTVRMTAAGIGLQDGSSRYVPVVRAFPGYEPSQTIEPHDAKTTALPVAELEQAGIDLYQPIIARVHLSSGEWIRSRPTTMRKRG